MTRRIDLPTGQPSHRPHVLLTGDYARSEFDDAVRWLRSHARLQLAAEIDQALVYLRGVAADPCVTVVAQSYPGQFSSGEIEQLHEQAPLSQLVGLLGSWCEGETRSGRPWPGVMRIYWHHFQARMASILGGQAGATPQLLPRTSSLAEQFEVLQRPDPRTVDGWIAVSSRSYNSFDALAESLRALGIGSVWLRHCETPEVRGATAILLEDDAQWTQPQGRATIGRMAQVVPVVALLDFPRSCDTRLILDAGASAVVSRPFLISDLMFQIDRAVRGAASTRQVA